MVAYWLWMSRKVGSHFADTKQVAKISSHFAVNSWPWLLLRYLIEPFLSAKISSYLCLSVKIFSCLCSYFWGGSFETYFLREQLFFWVFIHTHGCFLNGCSFCFKMFLVTDQFNIRLQFWLNLCSDIFFVKINTKTEKTKIHSRFLIFLILHLHYDITKSYKLSSTLMHIKVTNNTEKKRLRHGCFLVNLKGLLMLV